METIISTIVGLVGGFVVSCIVWYVTVRKITPRLAFSDAISKIVGADGSTRYRLKFANLGRRGIIDIQCRILLIYPNLMLNTDPPVRAMRTLVVKPSKQYMRIKGRGGNQVVDLGVAKFIDRVRNNRVITELYRVDAQRDDLTIEGLLGRSPGTYIEMSILCYDEWSGARKFFRSPRYGLVDVKEGRFDDLNVVAG